MDDLQALFAMMGEPDGRHADPAAWEALEDELEVVLPDDYKTFVDAYAPIQVNGMHFDHPAAPGTLLRFMKQTISTFQEVVFEEDVLCPGYESTGPLFGGAEGMTPLCQNDRGDYVFLAPAGKTEPCRILSCDADEQDFYGYRMSFSTWFRRYLDGDDMVGPDSSAHYPGPLLLERWPAGGPHESWFGPQRDG
ncbi:SMI1/KNR4 family protein [Streptomyces sp. NPDC014894]|uniref:SMI1/KNR4 family protein n=1 Tax=Streptomyces sp. NPDC014894 TaxID=3364931 RepID=UPI0036F718DB